MKSTVHNIAIKEADLSHCARFFARRQVRLTEQAVVAEQKLAERTTRRKRRLEYLLQQAIARQQAKQARKEASPLYHKLPWLYSLLTPIFFCGRLAYRPWRWCTKSVERARLNSPHRTFYITDPSQTRRTIRMQGYLGFVGEVFHLIWDNKRLFAKYILLSTVITVFVIGNFSQYNLSNLRDSLVEGGVDGFHQIAALTSQAITSFGTAPTGGQEVAMSFVVIYGWLTVVWLCRKITNGQAKKLRLRDGLYNSGASLVGWVAIIGTIMLQCIPAALACIAYYVATSAQWINSGIQIENMAFWVAMVLVGVLTMYWVTPAVLALMINTLPGMYPIQSIKMARELVAGRRLSVLLRFIVMAVIGAGILLFSVALAVMFDTSVIHIEWIPFVPLVTALVSSAVVVWFAAYMYLMYRNIIDDPTPPYHVVRPKKFHWKNLRRLNRINSVTENTAK